MSLADEHTALEASEDHLPAVRGPSGTDGHEPQEKDAGKKKSET